tara:strand:- start:258609 stop:259574 length:966 start_codon:yes stop_codon:yes gene_type:complete
MLFNRYIEIKELPSGFEGKIDYFFVGPCVDDRSKKVYEEFKPNMSGKLISISYNIENEKFLLEEVQELQEKLDTDRIDAEGCNLLPDFITQIENLDINNKVILLDATSLMHPLLFYFIKVLRQYFTPKNLFICYTEPKKYKQKDNSFINQSFDLTEKFCDRSSLPGFLTLSRNKKNRLLVAIMGFEGNRFSKTFEEVNPTVRKTMAIVGFPSFHPSWQYYVYSQNREVLEQSKAYLSIYRASAFEPFEVYNILDAIKKNNPDNDIIVAPLGTKPHSIGACMFCIDNEDVSLHYDYPFFGKKIRTDGIGKSYIYNLSSFINE